METKSLLLVDDDAVFRKFVAQTFRSLPFVLREAATGKAAELGLAAAPPDVILLDGLLPDMGGMQFIERNRASIGDTPIIFISSFWKDFASFQKLTQGLRVAAVLHKPVRSAELLSAVAKVLAPRPASTSPALARQGLAGGAMLPAVGAL